MGAASAIVFAIIYTPGSDGRSEPKMKLQGRP
jgi:hypothetical protein